MLGAIHSIEGEASPLICPGLALVLNKTMLKQRLPERVCNFTLLLRCFTKLASLFMGTFLPLVEPLLLSLLPWLMRVYDQAHPVFDPCLS